VTSLGGTMRENTLHKTFLIFLNTAIEMKNGQNENLFTPSVPEAKGNPSSSHMSVPPMML